VRTTAHQLYISAAFNVQLDAFGDAHTHQLHMLTTWGECLCMWTEATSTQVRAYTHSATSHSAQSAAIRVLHSTATSTRAVPSAPLVTRPVTTVEPPHRHSGSSPSLAPPVTPTNSSLPATRAGAALLGSRWSWGLARGRRLTGSSAHMEGQRWRWRSLCGVARGWGPRTLLLVLLLLLLHVSLLLLHVSLLLHLRLLLHVRRLLLLLLLLLHLRLLLHVRLLLLLRLLLHVRLLLLLHVRLLLLLHVLLLLLLLWWHWRRRHEHEWLLLLWRRLWLPLLLLPLLLLLWLPLLLLLLLWPLLLLLLLMLPLLLLLLLWPLLLLLLLMLPLRLLLLLPLLLLLRRWHQHELRRWRLLPLLHVLLLGRLLLGWRRLLKGRQHFRDHAKQLAGRL
jgi:hypothetical protein